MNGLQVIWVVEPGPIWYYDFGVAMEEFMSHQCDNDPKHYQTGIYSVLLPRDYTRIQIQEWAEYNCDALPRFRTTNEEEPWTETEQAAYNGLSSADYHNPL